MAFNYRGNAEMQLTAEDAKMRRENALEKTFAKTLRSLCLCG